MIVSLANCSGVKEVAKMLSSHFNEIEITVGSTDPKDPTKMGIHVGKFKDFLYLVVYRVRKISNLGRKLFWQFMQQW